MHCKPLQTISQPFKRYARNYRFELIGLQDPLAQLEAGKLSVKKLFKDLLDEIKGFKYQLTLKLLLRKHKENGGIEFAPVYLSSITEAVINICLINPFKKFCIESIIELMKGIVG